MSETTWYLIAGLAVVVALAGLGLWLKHRAKKAKLDQIYPMW